MDLPLNLVRAKFKKRLNRFTAVMDIDGEEVLSHVANSGRLGELLIPDYVMLLRAVESPTRKTKFDLVLVDMGTTLCSVDSRMPNALLQESIQQNFITPFSGFENIRREVTYGASRFDLFLSRPGTECFIEAKSVTLVENRIALFPDAPTVRGSKHLRGLMTARSEGYRSCVVFVIQRSDADSLTVQAGSDSEFARTLCKAIEEGVEAYAYICKVTKERIQIHKAVPINL
jgi:sugar fermentation stimulation protein A